MLLEIEVMLLVAEVMPLHAEVMLLHTEAMLLKCQILIANQNEYIFVGFIRSIFFILLPSLQL